MDEAKFYKEETLRNGPLAMLLQEAVLLFASTPEMHEDPCAGIINGVYHGERICEFLNFKLICPDCELIRERNRSHLCDHRAGWRPIEDPDLIGMIQVAYGNPESFEREVMAAQVMDTRRFIPNAYLEAMESSDWYRFSRPPDYIFVGIDPGTNSLNFEEGKRSFFGMVTACIVDGQFIVSVSFVHAHSYHSSADWGWAPLLFSKYW